MQVAPFVDVITAGAIETTAPRVEEIRKMREAIGDHPIAIAGNLPPENIQLYAPYVDCFLLTARISDSRAGLDPTLVKQCASALGK